MRRFVLGLGFAVLWLLLPAMVEAEDAFDLVGRWRLYEMMSVEGVPYAVSIPEQPASLVLVFSASGEYQLGPHGSTPKAQGYWLLDAAGQRVFVAGSKTATKNPDYAFSVLSRDALLLAHKPPKGEELAMYLAVRDVEHPAVPAQFGLTQPAAGAAGVRSLSLSADFQPMSAETLDSMGFTPGGTLEGTTYRIVTSFGYARPAPFSMVAGFTVSLDALGAASWEYELGDPSKLAAQMAGADASDVKGRDVQIAEARGVGVAWNQSAGGEAFAAEMVAFRRGSVGVFLMHMRFKNDVAKGPWPDLIELGGQVYGQLAD